METAKRVIENQINNANVTNIFSNQIVYPSAKGDDPWVKIEEGKPYINLKDPLRDKFIENSGVKMIGREDGLAWLAQFKESGPGLRVGAVCGCGGVGKTRLVLDFFHQCNWDGWCAIASNWLDLKDNGFTKKTQIQHNVFFVLDYVMGYADKIGEWIRKLWNKVHMEGSAFRVRVLLIERAEYSESQTPYWYVKTILQNSLQDICGEKNLLHLTNLEDGQLLDIAMEYLSASPAAAAKPDYKLFLDDSKRQIHGYLAKSSSRCKTPLYTLCAADALLNGHKIEQFDKHFFKQYIQRKLQKKIYSVFPKNHGAGRSLENIFVYSLAVSGIDLKKTFPVFLQKDFETLKAKANSARGTLKSVLLQLDLNIKEKNNEMYIFYELPGIAKELYCLEYLQEMKLDRADEESFSRFIHSAWSEKPREFMEFLCRVAEDYPEHPFASMEGIFQFPENLEYKNYIYYLEVLREITFWGECKYADEIMQVFDHLYQKVTAIDQPDSRNVAEKIAEIYALCLFNLLWYLYKKIRDSNTADSSHGKKYKEKLKWLLSTYPGSEIIKQSYDLSEKTEYKTAKLKNMQALP